MRWFWQRRRKRQATADVTPLAAPSPAPATPSALVQRAQTTSARLGQPRQLNSELLLLARDYLQAAGGHVRVEDEDMLSATMPDGAFVRYTTTLAKARDDDGSTLLVEGSEALTSMLDDIARHSRLTALRLAPAADPIALALEHCATPPTACGHCLHSERVALCEPCPLRENRFMLRWRTPGPLIGRVVQQETSSSTELAYLVAARDRGGRRDEWLRHAVDETGKMTPLLSEDALATARAESLLPAFARALASACAAAEQALSMPLTATGVFLRQRSLDEYRRRLDEIATTFDRLKRESPETARTAKAGRSRELAALADIYAVEVEAQLESACFILSPHALVAVRPQSARGELLLRIDIGRQHVAAPACAVCGTIMQVGYVCDAGHAVCVSCAGACAQCGEWTCATCGELSSASCAKCGHPTPQRDSSGTNEVTDANDVFTIRHLDVLPAEMWFAAIEWVLSRQGIAVDSARTVGDVALWRGQSDLGRVAVAAFRPRGTRALDGLALRQAAAHLQPDQDNVTRMILASAPATDDARQTAAHLGLRLLDREALSALLDTVANAQKREHEQQHEQMQARADAASSTRQTLLGVLETVESGLAPASRSRRAGGQAQTRATGVAGVRALTQARNSFERAAMAWDTLLADWTAAFGERATRIGTLPIAADVERFVEFAERASHLQRVMLDAIALLVNTPTHGESGYVAWRQALVEEYRARCVAWRWRIRTIDPAEWSDFARAWNAKTAAKAAEASNAASHATARADKAQSQAPRAG